MEWRRLKMSKENEMYSSLRNVLFVAVLAFIGLFLSSCSEHESIDCPYGHICPGGMVCAANQAVCLEKNGEDPICGDGKIEGDEECDDGNITDGDGCSIKCIVERCGNGIEKEPIFEEEAGGIRTPTDATEVCDHGDDPNQIDITCSADCRTNYLCGNGIIDENNGEKCDHTSGNILNIFKNMQNDPPDMTNDEFRETDWYQDLIKNPNNTYEPTEDGLCEPACRAYVGCRNGILDNYIWLGANKELCDVKLDGNGEVVDQMFDVDEKLDLLRQFSKEWLEERGVLITSGGGDAESFEIYGSSSIYEDSLIDKFGGLLNVETYIKNHGGSLSSCEECKKCYEAPETGNDDCTKCQTDEIGDYNECILKEAFNLSTKKQKKALKDYLKENGYCSADCYSFTFCGDGVLDTKNGEECELQTVGEPTSTCWSDCTTSSCGDGHINTLAGEECDCRNDEETKKFTCYKLNDEGNEIALDDVKECNTTNGACKLNKPGDNFLGFGEECDLGVYDGRCHVSGDNSIVNKWNVCGDGIIGKFPQKDEQGNFVEENGERKYTDVWESCEPGRDVEGQVQFTAECTNECKPSGCGDGVVNPVTEQCDCGGKMGTEYDDCLNYCNYPNVCKENKCGDGYLGGDEECDVGGATTRDCIYDESNPEISCKKSFCGDGVVNDLADEQCDCGGMEGEDLESCKKGCVYYEDNTQSEYECKYNRCGDAYKGGDEQCDSGEELNIKQDTEEYPRMKMALEAYCGKYTSKTLPKTVFRDGLGDQTYNFCKCPEGEGVCELDTAFYNDKNIENFYNDEDIENKSKHRNQRAAAEYYYLQDLLEGKRYAGSCLAVNSANQECQNVVCGNGVIDIGEVCDSVSSIENGKVKYEYSIDALTEKRLPEEFVCSVDCRSIEIDNKSLCGNGIVETGEVCEPPIGSCNECTSGQLCGNGIIDQGESCDLLVEGSVSKTDGYCVMTESPKVDSSWVRLEYEVKDEGKVDLVDVDESERKSACREKNGVWVVDEEDETQSACYLVTNCIRENRHNKCLQPKDCGGLESLHNCYEADAKDPDSSGSCEAGWELLDICIYKSCALASCGDGYVFEGVEGCDHGQSVEGIEQPQEKLEQKLTEACEEKCSDPSKSSGDEESLDACLAECINGIVQFSQLVEEENPYCNYNCKVNECGDGILNKLAGEECDWGASNGVTTCPGGELDVTCQVCTKLDSSTGEVGCRLKTIGCGNGIVEGIEGKETCDYNQIDDNGQKIFAGSERTECSSYPCRICENVCGADNTYYYVKVASISGKGTVLAADAIDCVNDAEMTGRCEAYLLKKTDGENVIQFTAHPALGWKFVRWTSIGCDASSNTNVLTCNETALASNNKNGREISATFEEEKYKVTLSADGEGTISATCINDDDGTCSCISENGAVTCEGSHTDTISVTANAETGYTFVKWENGCSDVSQDGLTCTNTIGTGWSNKAIFAKQYKVEYSVAKESSDLGSISSTVTSGSSVVSGTIVTLLAVPNSNQVEFVGWTLTDETYSCLSNPCIVEITEQDLKVEASFKKKDPTVTVEARCINGTNASNDEDMPNDVALLFSCVETGTNTSCSGPDETNSFKVDYEKSYTISYTTTSDEFTSNVYRFASWTGCDAVSYNNISGQYDCEIKDIDMPINEVKLIFYKSKFNLNFAFKGLLVGETLKFTCTGSETAGTDCRSLFNHKETVTVALDIANSVCTSDKHFSLSIGTSGEPLSYSCDCAAATEENDFRRYTNCRTKSEDGTETTESSSDPTSFSVMMDSDKTVNVVVTKDEAFLLSSAENGALVEQMHGSVLGKVKGVDSAQVAYYCQPGDCTSAFVEKGSDVELTATPATGYELTAWRVQVNGAVNYYDSPADDYTIDLEQGTFSFAMQAPMDVTPVFMPTLTVTASPADSATFTCTLSGCSDASNNTACVLSPISDGSLYNGYPQSIECAQSEGSCEIPACAGAFSSEAVIDIEVTDHSSGYHSAGWSISDEERVCSSTDACKIENIDAPLSVTVNSEAKTGNISWNYQNASEAELSQISYQKAELRCRKHEYFYNNESLENCSENNENNKYVRYITVEVDSESWSNGYYIISVPVLNDREVKLTCPGQLYRCVSSDQAGSVVTTDSYDDRWYQTRVDNALNELKDKFSESSMGYSCSSGQNVECLYQYDENNKTISVEYGDIEKNLRVDCGQMAVDANIEITVTWNTLSGSHQAKLKCDGEKEIAQNAALQFELTSIDEGYEIAEWQFGDETGCSNHPTCTGWTMPTSNEDIRPVVHRKNVALTLQSFPKTEAPDRGTFSCSTFDAGTNTWGDYSGCESTYPYDTHISVKATPVGNNEFLKLMNGSGCPNDNGWTETGVCENIVMTEDQIVSAVFSTKPVVSFNSNQEGCSITCVDCESPNSPVSVPTKGTVKFTADIDCGDYELLETHNLRNCSVNSNGQWDLDNGQATCELSNVTSSMNYVYAVYTPKPTLNKIETDCVSITCQTPENCAAGPHLTETDVNASASVKVTDECSVYELLSSNNTSTCLGGSWTLSTEPGLLSCTGKISTNQNKIEARITKKPILTLGYGSTSGGRFVTCPDEEAITPIIGAIPTSTSNEPFNVCVQADSDYDLADTGCSSGWLELGNKISSCEVTMNGNQTVIASFIHNDEMKVTVKYINEGTYQCAKVDDTASCSTATYNSCDASDVTTLEKGETLCVKAIDNSETGWEFDSTNSICPSDTDNWEDDICSVTNTGGISNETVLAVFKAMPTVTLVPTTGGTFINCETGLEISDANLMPTAYPSMSEVQVCVMPSEGYELKESDREEGCPEENLWEAVTGPEITENSELNGAYKCTITSLNANQVVHANFSVKEVEVKKTNIVVLTKIGNGTLSCAVINAPDATCPSEETSYTETACQQNQIAEGETLCIKASGSEGSDSQPATEFNPANSSCSGAEWSENDVCSVSYQENGEAQSVVAYFNEKYKINFSLSEGSAQYGYESLITVIESTCAEINGDGIPSTSESYGSGTSLCIRAPVHDKTNASSLNRSVDGGCFWNPSTDATDGIAYYYCDVTMTGDKIITLTATAWPTVTVSGNVTMSLEEGVLCTGGTETYQCAIGALVTATAPSSTTDGQTLNVGESICPNSSWILPETGDDSGNATCEFTMGEANASVSAVYVAQPSAPTLTVNLSGLADDESVSYSVYSGACEANMFDALNKIQSETNTYPVTSGQTYCIRAELKEGYNFSCDGLNSNITGSEATCSVDIGTENRTVTLSYTGSSGNEEQPSALTLTVEVDGLADDESVSYSVYSGACSDNMSDALNEIQDASNTYSVTSGQTYCIKAEPVDGYTLSPEASTCNGSEWALGESEATCSVTIGEQDKTVTLSYNASENSDTTEEPNIPETP